MNILDAKIYWYIGYANQPRLHLLVDKLQLNSEFKWRKLNDFLWTENENFIKFYLESENKGGFGGAVFNLPMEDGSIYKLEGPGASRSSWFNKFGPQCIDSIVTDNPAHFDYSGNGGYYLKLDKAQEIIKELGTRLICDTSSNYLGDSEIRYTIDGKISSDSIKKSYFRPDKALGLKSSYGDILKLV